MSLTKVSDEELKAEYLKRFTLPVGAQILHQAAAADHFRSFITDPARESFLVLFLNGNNCAMATEILFSGTLTSAAVFPREVIRKVLEHQSASVILCHNHPSGNLKPSRDDIEITRKIREAVNTIDVKVHDHIIITAGDFYSFAEYGLI